MSLSNYPPGVSGTEPEITGVWPCRVCEGAGADLDSPGSVVVCWYCQGSGVDPEDAPPCPSCGADDTEFADDGDSGVVLCASCGAVSEP